MTKAIDPKPRRRTGQSAIVQEADGRWHGYVSMGSKPDGSRDRRHVAAIKRADVVRKVKELEKHRDEGLTVLSGKPPTVAAWMDYWLEQIAARKVRPRTIEGYRQKTAHHIKPHLGNHRVDKLLPEHVEAWQNQLLDDGASPASVLQCHRILSRALTVAHRRGRISRNPCTLVDTPTVDRAEIVPLTLENSKKVLAAAVGDRNAARWTVALALGLRQGEALGIAWTDVDLDAGTMRVRQALQRQKGAGLMLVPPKSRAGNRTLTLPRPLVDALKAHRTTQLAERMAAGSKWDQRGWDLLFTSELGAPIDPRSDARAWKALLEKAKVSHARLHDARHTAATLLLIQGVQPRVVMELLGHSQIALTLGTYSHVVPELHRDAADRMSKALWGH